MDDNELNGRMAELCGLEIARQRMLDFSQMRGATAIPPRIIITDTPPEIYVLDAEGLWLFNPATDIGQVFEYVVAWLIQRGFRLSTSCQRGVTDVRIWWDNNRCSVDVQRIGEASHEIMARQICEAALKAKKAMEDNDGKEGV